MAQRHMCLSMGSFRRSIITETTQLSRCPSRALSGSAQRLEEQTTNAPSSASTPANPSSRRERSATALKQITSLQNRRIPPGGQLAIRRISQSNPSDAANNDGGAASGPRNTNPAGLQMARAPNTLKITRQAVGSAARGPNLGARQGGDSKANPRGRSGGREQGPKRRGRKQREDGGQKAKPTSFNDTNPAETLSDGMVQQLLRLQRKEWDRVPYEPKYAPGSFAAKELIHEGRELFRGEAPPVKIWGELEKRIGVVGMFGAEAHLKVRRVPDGDDAPFGQEEAEDAQEDQKTPAAQ